MNRFLALPLLALAATTLIGGCSGSQADLSGTGEPPESTRSKKGPVTGFGSIIVAGESFATGSASFTLDGAPGSEDQLEVGMIVRLRIAEDGRLRSVAYGDTLRGPVSAIDTAADTLTVLNQTVRTDGQTNFEGTLLQDLMPGDRVEVSAEITSDGSYLASYVGLLPADDEVEIQGRVSQHDRANQRFLINQLEVSYAEAAEFDLEGDTLEDGLLVEVEGQLDVGGLLRATSVESLRSLDSAVAGEQADLVGLIDDPDAAGFELDDILVRVDDSTRFLGGDRETIGEDLPVRVLGQITSSAEVLASSVEFLPRISDEIEARVQSINDAEQRLTMQGDLVVQLDSRTRYDDDSEAGERRFGAGDIRVGDRLEVAGYFEAGVMVAISVSREEDDRDGDNEPDPQEFEGRLESLDSASRSFRLAGTTLFITDQSEFNGYADEADFFATARAGDALEVSAAYDESSGRTLALEVDRRDSL